MLGVGSMAPSRGLHCSSRMGLKVPVVEDCVAARTG